MNVLLVNTYDRGGAANSCKRLHLGLLLQNFDSKILVKQKENHWPETFQFLNKRPPGRSLFKVRGKKRLERLFDRVGQYIPFNISEKQGSFLSERATGLEMFSFPNSGIDITVSELYEEADIINLHWVANFIDFQSFFRKNTKPVVWTLHDMNAFSGGEHYEEIFLDIDEAGFPKHRKTSPEEMKISKKNKLVKRKAMAGANNVTIVAPSRWLAEEAAKSEVFKGKKILHIPYGLDPEMYYPQDKIKSREFFNIPQEKKVILFVADSLKKNRKGFIFLKRAFELLEGGEFLLCAVGGVDTDFEGGKNFVKLGTIEEEELIGAAYSAADVFIIPSLMDNLPNTVLESIMCGTPVIGFPVGGIPEMIENGKNGLITEEISVLSLHKTILKFFNNIEEFNSEEIRKDAVENYNLNIQADRYVSLFHDLLSRKKKN